MYKILEFTTLLDDDIQLTLEHIGIFIIRCGDINDSIKVRLFGNSLTLTTINCYVGLPPNLVQSWTKLQTMFHSQFYKIELEITMVDFAKFRQQPKEKSKDFGLETPRQICLSNT